MTLDQIRYFLEVAYCHNFSQAAQNLYISQPNLTKYIASMEKELGIKLFNRTTRKVELTEAGERLMSKAQSLFLPFLREVEDIQSELRSKRRNIYIGVARDEILPPPLVDVIRRRNLSDNSGRIIMIQDSHQELSHGLRGQYSMIISSDRQLRSLPALNALRLQGFQMILAVSRHHPLAHKPTLSPSDFRSELIYFALPQGTAMTPGAIESIYYRMGGLVNIKLLPSPDDALYNADLCSGAAIVPELTDSSRFPDVRFVNFDSHSDETPTYQRLFWPKEEDDPIVCSLVEELSTLFGPPEIG